MLVQDYLGLCDPAAGGCVRAHKGNTSSRKSRISKGFPNLQSSRIEPNHSPRTGKATPDPCPQVPHPHGFGHLQGHSTTGLGSSSKVRSVEQPDVTTPVLTVLLHPLVPCHQGSISVSSPGLQLFFTRVTLFLCCRICLHTFLPLCQALLALEA